MENNFRKLLDAHSVCGTNFDDFKDVVKELTEKTVMVPCVIGNLQSVISATGMLKVVVGGTPSLVKPHDVGSDGENLSVHGKTIDKKNEVPCVGIQGFFDDEKLRNIVLGELVKDDGFRELVKEMEAKNGTMIRHNDEIYFFSEKGFTSFLAWLGLGGEYFARCRGDIKASFIKKACIDAPKQGCQLVVRNEGNVKKIFALVSESYANIPQTAIIEVIDSVLDEKVMGKAEVFGWEVEHDFTRVVVDFPEYGEEVCKAYGLSTNLIPCLIIETSDTAECSLICRGGWRLGTSYSTQAEVSRKHIGNVDISKFMDKVSENIFDTYAKLPERLCELMLQTINPSIDLSTPDGVAYNLATIEEIVKQCFKHLNISLAVGKKQAESLMKQLIEEFDPARQYVAFDFAVKFLQLPERVTNLSHEQQKNFEKALGKAPYFKFDEVRPAKKAVIL